MMNLQPRILLGPGPSEVSERVRQALAQPTIGHLDPQFCLLMDEVAELLRATFLTQNHLTMAVSAPGSAGMETCFGNLMEPGDRVLVCVNGLFGVRMLENVRRLGGEPIALEAEWGQQVAPDALSQVLGANPDVRLVAFVHAETSTGVCNDVRELGRIAREHECLSIADTVTSLAGVELRVDDWGLDAVYSGTQKCLSCVPGLSPLTISGAAVERIKGRHYPVSSWFLDLSLVMQYWDGEGGRTYHHTAPVNSVYALREALLQVREEGLENAWQRHRRHHAALVIGLEAMGLELLVSPVARLPQLNAVRVPEGVDEAGVRRYMLEHFSIEIGPGLGPLAGQIWRIGLMGSSCNQRNVLSCLSGLQQALQAQGHRAVDNPVESAGELYESYVQPE